MSYGAELHDPDDEPISDELFDFDFEKGELSEVGPQYTDPYTVQHATGTHGFDPIARLLAGANTRADLS
jgi:hypothetical protein